MGTLLLRGMLVGLVAGLLTFAFLKTFGEPSVERAIAFEAQHDGGTTAGAAQPEGSAPKEPTEPEIVSRPTQAGIGLFTGVTLYAAAFGGLFALAFALVYGRAGDLGPRATSALLAGAGFVTIYLVPSLKYPANPPSVGDPETIGLRTAMYFALIALSLAAAIAAALLRNRLATSQGRWNATLLAGLGYCAAMAVASASMPGYDEVPAAFPAATLWSFRVASIGAQLLLWTTLGLGFGALTHRVATRSGIARLDAAVV